MLRKSLSRYTSDWSARIDYLKKTLVEKQRISEPVRQLPPHSSMPGQNYRPVEDRAQVLSEQFKIFQEASAHEIRQISKRCQELEEFVKAKEIDLQNLKSDSVEHRLVHEDLKKKIAEQSGGEPQTAEHIEKNIRELTDRINALQMLITSRENSPDKSYFSRWLAWWNEPVAKIPVSKGGAD